MSVEASSTNHRQVIEAGRTASQYWRDIWRYRELFAFLTWRDVSVRYKQTVIGILWAMIQPLVSVVILTFIFQRLANMDAAAGVPAPVFTYSGTLPWLFFAAVLSGSSNSLVANSRLITKVYFPRLLVPLTTLGVSLVDFCISFTLFLLMCALFGFLPSWKMIFLPLLLLWAALTAYSIGIWFTALNVRFRDFRFLLPFILQFGMFISPVGYSSAEVREYQGIIQFIYHLNPMVAVIDGFRWALLGTDAEIYLPGMIGSFVIVGVLLWTGILFFRRVERTFADVI